MEENKKSAEKPIIPIMKLIIGIIIILFAVFSIFKGYGGEPIDKVPESGPSDTVPESGPSDTVPESGPSDEEVISCAKTLICKYLKSPSSAIFSGEEVVDEDDYGRYCIKFLCEASNSFGGSIQNYYIVVLQSVDSDGSNFKYLPSVAYQTISPSYATDKLIESVINNVKQANGWNEEPKENDGD